MYNYKRTSRMLNKISIHSNIKSTTSSFLNTRPKTLKFTISVNSFRLHKVVSGKSCPVKFRVSLGLKKYV